MRMRTTSKRTMREIQQCFSLLLICLSTTTSYVSAFVVPTTSLVLAPRAIMETAVKSAPTVTTQFMSTTPTDFYAMIDPDIASTFSSSSLSVSNDVGDIIRNFGLVVGVLVILVVGFLTLFSTVIIPQAAEQLETQAKSDFPDLWEDIAAANLQPGESLVQRPDIMQALGTKVRQRIETQLGQAVSDKQEQESKQSVPTTTGSSSSSSRSSSIYRNSIRTNSVVDAEVVKEEDQE